MTETILHQKIVRENGDIIEMRILRVEKDKAHPECLRYSLVYIRERKRIVGYDNFEGKGHHKHLAGKELPYAFSDVEVLVNDFKKDVKEATGEDL